MKQAILYSIILTALSSCGKEVLAPQKQDSVQTDTTLVSPDETILDLPSDDSNTGIVISDNSRKIDIKNWGEVNKTSGSATQSSNNGKNTSSTTIGHTKPVINMQKSKLQAKSDNNSEEVDSGTQTEGIYSIDKDTLISGATETMTSSGRPVIKNFNNDPQKESEDQIGNIFGRSDDRALKKPTCKRVGHNKACGFSYSGGYPQNVELHCKITYFLPNSDFQQFYSEEYFTNCGTCTQGALAHYPNIESPAYQSSRIMCEGQPLMDEQWRTRHSFQVETLQDSSCKGNTRYFTFKLEQCE